MVLYKTDGRRTRLRMPSSGFLSRDRDVRRQGRDHPKLVACQRRRSTSTTQLVNSAPGGVPTAGCPTTRMRPAPSRSVPTALLLGWLAAEAVMAGFAEGPGADHPTLLGRTLGALRRDLAAAGRGLPELRQRRHPHGRPPGHTRGAAPNRSLGRDSRDRRRDRHRGGRRLVVLEAGVAVRPCQYRVSDACSGTRGAFEAKTETLGHWWRTRAEMGDDPDRGGAPTLGPATAPSLPRTASVAGRNLGPGLHRPRLRDPPVVLVGTLFLTVGE